MSAEKRSELTNKIDAYTKTIHEIDHKLHDWTTKKENCRTHLNNLRNTQLSLKAQDTPRAAQLRMDITKWENRSREASTHITNLRVDVTKQKERRTHAQETLTRMQTAAAEKAKAKADKGH
ncbi:hypothetical protein PLICRDRAFT_35284 [Plicaturopsis crispa FD-325 SS-3]|nr:hypothetical protein PLICRDRAFT_35284 [Plicaturopsis crispa FD-325 SS-3]